MKALGLLKVQFVILLSYLVSNILFGRLGLFLVPLHNFFGAYIIYRAVRQMDSSKLQWHLLSLTIALKGLGDLVYYVGSQLGFELSCVNVYVVLLFAGSSFALLNVVITYFAVKLNRYAITQVVVDGLFVVLIILGTGSGLYAADIEMAALPTMGFIVGTVYSMIVLLTLAISLLLLISSRNKAAHKTAIGVAIAVFVHLVADGYIISNYYLFGGTNTIISNVLTFISFDLIVFTAYTKINQGEDEPNTALDHKDNIGSTWFVFVLILIPFVTFVIGLIDMTHLVFLSLVIILYLLFNSIVQKQLATDVLLVKEQLIKADLEVLVNEKTLALQKSNTLLRKEVTLDFLTELYNRRYFMDVVKEKIMVRKAPFSVVFIDLNRFKVINDIHGHAMGDEVLKRVADRFREFNQGKLRIARFGGDEFAIVLDECDLLTLEMIAVDVSNTIRQPLIVGDLEFNIGASIGVARYPIDATTVGELIKYADIAMYNTCFLCDNNILSSLYYIQTNNVHG